MVWVVEAMVLVPFLCEAHMDFLQCIDLQLFDDIGCRCWVLWHEYRC
jgi:hypothetical protein